MDYQGAIDFILERLKRELPADLKYHALIHTASVIRNCRKIAEEEGISDRNLRLLLTAAAYHDAGFLQSYEKNEPQGCQIARNTLPGFGFSAADVHAICAMIMATQPPQSPQTKLEMVLCDADLFYLGGDQYEEIADSLYRELLLHGKKLSQDDWLKVQIKSLREHRYFTDFAKRSREPKKKIILSSLEAMAIPVRKSGS